MFICPACHENLSREQNDFGVFWVCPSCGGRAITVPVLRKGLSRETVNSLWQGALSTSAPRLRNCPACLAPMSEVSLPVEHSVHSIEVCTRCQIVWFDMHEYESMPMTPPTPPTKTFMQSLPPEVRERYAMHVIRELERQHEIGDKEANLPEHSWQYIPALFGLPFERTRRAKTRLTWITWSLTVLIIISSIIAFYCDKDVVLLFGLVPAKLIQSGGLTLFTSVFLHGGFIHLLSNMYFLMLFGDDVEDLLGSTRYVLLLLLAALIGGLAHVLGNLDSTVPCIGASGVISGIITYYALAFPHARLGWMFRFGVIIKWVNLSSRTMFLLWFVLQLVGVWKQINGFSQVSALAHIGGVAAGALFWELDKLRNREKTKSNKTT